ncbi:MAG: DNA-3-methyladenine glycosylase 2 family protein [Hyphomicrobiaceae bacterium]
MSPGSARTQSGHARRSKPRIIRTMRDVRAGIAHLSEACPHMRAVHALAGDPPLRRRAAGFEGLARIVVGQQLSIASANAIWTRTQALAIPFTPLRLLALDDSALAGAGLSRPKIRTLRAAATAVAEGAVDLDALETLPDEGVHEVLTAVHGIGPWTADIYLLFCLGRADAWAAGDLALQVAAKSACGLAARPSQGELLEIAERWRPWRGVAARLLWSYYKVLQEGRSGLPV